MPRKTPPDRFERLIECATRVFIDRGYARTQMDDVARELGVAKGTLYLYVESKEALFDLVARAADRQVPLPIPDQLPVPTPAAGATIRFAQERLAAVGPMPELEAALAARGRVVDVRAELEEVVRELYRTLARNRTGIKLLDRSAQDYPELAEFWYRHGRDALMAGLVEYLRDRGRRGRLRNVGDGRDAADAGNVGDVGDVQITARLVVETMVFWAVHRHWDPHPQLLDDAAAENAVVRFICDALVAESSTR
ncbi:MAG: helix-turn-helix domain-containing protein [Candidatus Binatia bacterium]